MAKLSLLADDLEEAWIADWLASLVADLETLVAFENFCLARDATP